MSEELIQKRLTKSGIKVGNYEYYNIGNTTLKQLKKYKIIPNNNYKKYESRKPDALLVDRRNKSKIKVIVVQENKDNGKFSSKKDKKRTEWLKNQGIKHVIRFSNNQVLKYPNQCIDHIKLWL